MSNCQCRHAINAITASHGCKAPSAELGLSYSLSVRRGDDLWSLRSEHGKFAPTSSMNASRFKLPEQAGALAGCKTAGCGSTPRSRDPPPGERKVSRGVGPDERQEALDDRNKASRWQRSWRASSRTMIREHCTPGSTGGRGTLNKTEEIFSVGWAKEDDS
jgi:hypothetical protein